MGVWEFAHLRVCSFHAIVSYAWKLWTCGIGIDDDGSVVGVSQEVDVGGLRVDSLCAFNVRLVILMCHVDLESLIDIQEVTVNVDQRLIIPFERFQKNALGFEEASWNNCVSHTLQHQPPTSSVRASMRCSKEYDAVSTDVN